MNDPRVIVVVSDTRDAVNLPYDPVTADEYLEKSSQLADANYTIINLCRSFAYGSKGYYVSLLADARGQKVLPSIETSAGLAEPYARFRALQEAGIATIDAAEMAVRWRAYESENGNAALPPEERESIFPRPLICEGTSCRLAGAGEYVETIACLGVCCDPRFQQAARAAYNEWPAPLLRLQLVQENGEWKVSQVAAAAPHQLSPAERAHLVEIFGETERLRRAGRERARGTVRASIAVLMDTANPFSPSSPETIDRLERVADRLGVHIARISLNDLRKLPEYDALFVRSHTGVTHPAFQFALRAEALGMPVIDASQSTIRCTNKVFVEELLKREGIPTPHALIITANTPWSQVEQIGFPFVLKRPDGDFSAAVHKIMNRTDFSNHARMMFRRSPLLIVQEWLPTEFDWRIGVLDGRILFAARYYMARGHWQIRTVDDGTERYGKVQAIPREQAPTEVVEIAIRAAQLMGDGLYGVDLKETPHGPVVIEVNDNPNLDIGYEDTADGDLIYEEILQYFLKRIASGPPQLEEESGDEPNLREVWRLISSPNGPEQREHGPFAVAGLELEYPIVDRDLNVVSLVEPAFRLLAGRGTSDVDLGAIAFSNEFADHVFEIKTQQPVASSADAEALLFEGVQRFAAVLRDEFDARLLPTGMHPWFDPMRARLWTRSGLRVYTTYARLFDVRTHGWMNVQASHVNLPFGSEAETIAMLNASSLLIPYLPAVAASSPMHDGQLQDVVDARADWLTRIQARIPESCGAIIPEYVRSFSEYKKSILQPMYERLDQMHDASALRNEFFNSRAAILRFSRKALEVRVLDTQECVKTDVALAAFVRWALKHLTNELLAGRIELPPHDQLVRDFHSTVRRGSAARVRAPHVLIARDSEGCGSVKEVLNAFLAGARAQAPEEEQKYLDLVEDVIRHGSLSERLRAALLPHLDKPTEEFSEAARRVYIELIDCLEANEPWERRWR